MKQTILIDGYNLLYQFPELRKELERNIEEARENLLARLSAYSEKKNTDLVVVFDGDDRSVPELENRQGVKVLFSKLPEQADHVIKRLIDQKSGRKEFAVVTSDREIVEYAKILGVRVVTSRRFAREMYEKPLHEAEKKYDHPLSKAELEEWMRLFGGEENVEKGHSEE